MSYIGQTRPLNIVTYPLNSIIGSGGAPRFGIVERDRGVIIESDRIEPQYTDYDEEFLTEQGALGETRIPGNVLSPALPTYLRNSLLPLDTWQTLETETEQEQAIADLEAQLQSAKADADAQLELEKKRSKITKWHMLTIGGITVTLIAIIYLIYRWK